MQPVLFHLNLALVCTCLLAAFADEIVVGGNGNSYFHLNNGDISPEVIKYGIPHPIAVNWVPQEQISSDCPAENKPITLLHTQVVDAQNPCMGIDISSLRDTNRRLRSDLETCLRARPEPEPWSQPAPMTTPIPEPEPKPEPARCTCPRGWYQYRNKCYKSYGQKASFHNAAAKCRRRGGQLAIETSTTSGFIWRHAYARCPGPRRSNGDCFMWIGLHYVGGRWQWVDGSPLTYKRWQPGEPNLMHNEHCAQVAQSYSHKRWYNNPCGRAHYFVCEQYCRRH